jgi:hypothetical protein
VTLFVTIVANPGRSKLIVGVRAGIGQVKVHIRNPQRRDPGRMGQQKGRASECGYCRETGAFCIYLHL